MLLGTLIPQAVKRKKKSTFSIIFMAGHLIDDLPCPTGPGALPGLRWDVGWSSVSQQKHQLGGSSCVISAGIALITSISMGIIPCSVGWYCKYATIGEYGYHNFNINVLVGLLSISWWSKDQEKTEQKGNCYWLSSRKRFNNRLSQHTVTLESIWLICSFLASCWCR